MRTIALATNTSPVLISLLLRVARVTRYAFYSNIFPFACYYPMPRPPAPAVLVCPRLIGTHPMPNSPAPDILAFIPLFKSPKMPFTSPRMPFTSPRITFTSPPDAFNIPQDDFYILQDDCYIPQADVYTSQQERHTSPWSLMFVPGHCCIPQFAWHTSHAEPACPRHPCTPPVAPNMTFTFPRVTLTFPRIPFTSQDAFYIPQDDFYILQDDCYIPQADVYTSQQERHTLPWSLMFVPGHCSTPQFAGSLSKAECAPPRPSTTPPHSFVAKLSSRATSGARGKPERPTRKCLSTLRARSRFREGGI